MSENLSFHLVEKGLDLELSQSIWL